MGGFSAIVSYLYSHVFYGYLRRVGVVMGECVGVIAGVLAR